MRLNEFVVTDRQIPAIIISDSDEEPEAMGL